MALTIADLFEHAADLHPDRMAVACDDDRRSFAELEQRANRLAHHLAAHGVRAGSHVGFCVRNSVFAVETMLAIYKLRAVTININYRYTAAEIEYVVDNADVVALVHDREFTPQVEAAAARVPGLGHTVVIEDGSTVAFTGTPYEAALAGASPERDFGERSPDDLYILYTGGTTGMPKGVMWRHEDIWRTLGGGINFVTGEPLADEWDQAKTGSVTGGMTRLCIAPLIHGNAQWATLAALFGGDSVVLVPRFDPDEIWRAIERHKVNVVVLIGDAMARPIIDAYLAGNYDASTVYAISSSAAVFSPTVKKQYVDSLPNTVVTDAIGSSETGFTGLGLVTKDSEQSAGGPRVNLNSQSIVIDEHDRPVAPGSGVIGRIARGGHVPLGYYKDPEKTAAMFVEVDGKRYVVPGDLAIVEADGTTQLLGRGNTSVNTGGEKVFPEEVEAALKSHPDVFDAIVIGLPDELLGQRVAALVELRPGTHPSVEEILASAREVIAGYKAPRSVWVVEQIQRLHTGKTDFTWARTYADEHSGEDLCAPRSATSSA